MFLAHSIRLRDPWRCEATEQGGVRWSRRFHRPTGMEADDQLLLVLSGLPAGAGVRVNGHGFDAEQSAVSGQPSAGSVASASSIQQPASPAVAAQFDLTAILGDANEIEIELPPTSPAASSPQPVTSFPYDARLAIIGHS
jgi:hypothetical protein